MLHSWKILIEVHARQCCFVAPGPQVVQYLLEAGASKERARTDNGGTPLHSAALSGCQAGGKRDIQMNQ